MKKEWRKTNEGYELSLAGLYEREILAYVYGGEMDGWFFCVPYYSNGQSILLKAMSIAEAKSECEMIVYRQLKEESELSRYYAEEIALRSTWDIDRQGNYELHIRNKWGQTETVAYVYKNQDGCWLYYVSDEGGGSFVYESSDSCKIDAILSIQKRKLMEAELNQKIADSLLY